ncbi:MAG: sulfotransferase [Acidimicrobiales bacterium]|nr:sulfotransferase [Acidimicrobiales bacterium]
MGPHDGGRPDGSPLVIGGLGGSGTRVYAVALRDAGVDLGRHFNAAFDNLVFTLLFKRPSWFASAGDAAIGRHLATFTRYSRDRAFTPGDLARLARSVVDHDPTVGRRESAERARAAFARRPRPERRTAPAWGWKEPNSHLFLPQLIAHYPGLRFVYVARHGLDMAYSDNKNQLRNFGDQFGFPFPTEGGEDAEAAAQLGYWIHMTDRAFTLGEELGDRFLYLRFDDLCAEPEAELRRLLDFAGVAPGADLAEIAAKVQTPASAGRWRDHADHPFTDDQLEAVRRFGFDV